MLTVKRISKDSYLEITVFVDEYHTQDDIDEALTNISIFNNKYYSEEFCKAVDNNQKVVKPLTQDSIGDDSSVDGILITTNIKPQYILNI